MVKKKCICIELKCETYFKFAVLAGTDLRACLWYIKRDIPLQLDMKNTTIPHAIFTKMKDFQTIQGMIKDNTYHSLLEQVSINLRSQKSRAAKELKIN